MFKLKCDDFLVLNEETGKYELPADQQVRDETEKNKWKNTGLTLLRDWRLYLMLVPMLVVYLLWRYAPMYELLAAFKDPTTPGAISVADQDWYGLENFRLLFFDTYSTEFWRAFRNTFTISFYGLVFGFPMPIILALLFNEVRSNITRSIIQVCVYLPKFMSTVIITTLAITLTRGPREMDVGNSVDSAGVISQFFYMIGSEKMQQTIIGSNRSMIFSTRYFRAIYEITGIWESAGYDSIVFFAAVIAVSPTSYEAAQIDGAGKMQQMRYVVIPGILSTVVIMLIMRIGSLLSVGYEKVYLMSNEGNLDVADIVATLSNSWANTSQQSLGIAAEMINNVTGMLLVIGANTVARRAADVSLY